MGKALPGTHPIACKAAGGPSIDVERLRGEALRVYLQNKLRELDENIAMLSTLGNLPVPAAQHVLHRQSHERDKIELSLDLDYLRASREAILTALNIL